MEAPNRQVFVNCPYDADYYPLLEAIAFAVCVCGYTPRFSGEKIESGLSRLAKIVLLIDECSFSLHDISRTELNRNQLPRFNMPFELGLALGRKYSFAAGGAAGLLILDREPYRYHESISDLSGCDPLPHFDEPVSAMRQIREWLPLLKDEEEGMSSELRLPMYGPIRLVTWFEQYRRDMAETRVRLNIKQEALPFGDLVNSIRVWLEANVTVSVDIPVSSGSSR
jgi:hypothetical protein